MFNDNPHYRFESPNSRVLAISKQDCNIITPRDNKWIGHFYAQMSSSPQRLLNDCEAVAYNNLPGLPIITAESLKKEAAKICKKSELQTTVNMLHLCKNEGDFNLQLVMNIAKREHGISFVASKSRNDPLIYATLSCFVGMYCCHGQNRDTGHAFVNIPDPSNKIRWVSKDSLADKPILISVDRIQKDASLPGTYYVIHGNDITPTSLKTAYVRSKHIQFRMECVYSVLKH